MVLSAIYITHLLILSFFRPAGDSGGKRQISQR